MPDSNRESPGSNPPLLSFRGLIIFVLSTQLYKWVPSYRQNVSRRSRVDFGMNRSAMGWSVELCVVQRTGHCAIWKHTFFSFLCFVRRLLLSAAENIAKQWSLTREDQDDFALQSQLKCEAAQNAGHFDRELLPVIIPNRKGRHSPDYFSHDQCRDAMLCNSYWTCFLQIID